MSKSVLAALLATSTLFLTAPAAVAQRAGAQAAPQLTAIRAGRLIADPRTDNGAPALLIVAGNRIQSVLPADAPIPAGAEVVDLSNAAVLPGLIDTHVHLAGDPGNDYRQRAVETAEHSALVGAKNALVTVKAGFTTVRDLGSASALSSFALRDAIREGLVPGPRILAAGRAIAIIGGHGDVNAFRQEVEEALSQHNTCTGAVECAARVRQLSKRGADVIKITATGGVLSQQARGLGMHFTPEEMRSIVDTAASLGLKVAAHAHGDDGILGATQAGVASVEHVTFASADTLKVMKEKGTYMVPTLVALTGVSERLGTGAYTPTVEAKGRQALDVWGKQVQAAMQSGIKVAFGTDAGVVEHGRNAEEFRLLVDKGGMTQRAALVSATVTAAELLGLEQEIGTLAPGKSADIIAVTGDPLNDPDSLNKMEFVMAQGKIIRLD